MLEPFASYSPPTAPADKVVMLVGEAPGEEEEKAGGVPFVGPAGKLLNRLMKDAGLRREQCHITNVFSVRPPGNNLELWQATKTDLKRLDRNYASPVMGNGKYLRPEFLCHVARLLEEVEAIQPDLIIGFGAVAMWALAGDGKIGNGRGVFLDLPCGRAIFTYHPANILRQYENYALAWRDLVKARKWLNGELTPPLVRRLCISPTWAEMEEWHGMFASEPYRQLGVDIETKPTAGLLTTVAFGWPTDAICLPLWNPLAPRESANIYPTVKEEARAVQWIRRFADLPNPKVLQHGLYDMQWLLDVLDIRLRNVTDDTAIIQHVIQPELKKKLGILASVYLNEPLWKYLLRKSAKDDNKADE